MRNLRIDATSLAARSHRPVPSHHRHSRRSAVSRRGFICGVGALVGAGVLLPASPLIAKKIGAAPKPIPNGFIINGQQFHTYLFGPGQEPATITDFNGFVGVTDVQGTGTATNPDGSTETLLFDTDMRFMQGVYVGQDEEVHKGTFGFV